MTFNLEVEIKVKHWIWGSMLRFYDSVWGCVRGLELHIGSCKSEFEAQSSKLKFEVYNEPLSLRMTLQADSIWQELLDL